MVDLFCSRGPRALVAALIVVAGSLLLGGCGGPSGAETLANGDFERNVGGAPEAWFLSTAARAKGEVVVVESGTRRLLLSPNAGNAPGPDPLGVGQMLDATPFHGRLLRLEARIGAEGGAAAVVGAALLDSEGNLITQLSIVERGGDGTLVAHVADTTAPVPAAARNLVVFASAEGLGGRAWFDEVRVEAAAPGVGAVGAPPEDGSFTATVRLDADVRLGPVPQTLFGMNVEWIRNANGLWNDEAGELDETIMDLSKEAGVTLLRFPGGAWSDAYRWRDGVGPQDARPTTPHYPGDAERSRHSVGTDEMAAFARRIGARLLITVNAGDGDAREAGEWAAYIRDAHGADLVHLWEIGNELYMKGDITGGSVPPEVYGRRVLEFAAAIRAEIPDARIAAIGLKNYGRYRFNDYPGWNETVLEIAGDTIDYLAVHNAYAPLTPDIGAEEGERAYRAMLAAPMLVAQNLRDTVAQIDAASGSATRRAGIAVTEWGPWFAIDPASPFFDHVKTLGSALHVARSLNVFLRDPRTTIATGFKLSDWLKMGWIGLTEDGGWRATPALSALGLYSRGLRGELIGVDVAGPVFSTPATGFIDAVRDAPLIDAVATKERDGRMTVILSSADLWRDARITIDLGEDGPFRMRTALLTGSAPDAHRGTRIMDVPGLTFAEPAQLGPSGAMRESDADSVPVLETGPEEVGRSFEVDLPAISLLRLTLEPSP